MPGDLAQRLSVRPDLVPAVLNGLGLRVMPAIALREGEFGPPAPPAIATTRRKPTEPPAKPAPIRRDSPFAALAALRR
jgi:ATP-dependent RNA helicase SUPV3L1/SUV3